MSQVVRLAPRAEVDARQRVVEFVALARDRLTALVKNDDWADDVWDVGSSFIRKGKPDVTSRLHFFRRGTRVGQGNDCSGESFEEPFADFARAYIRYQHSTAPMTFGRVRARLHALIVIDAAFSSLGRRSDVTMLSADVLFAAVRIGSDGVGSAIRYQRAAMVQALFKFAGKNGFLATPFIWKHGIRKYHCASERIGDAFAKQRATRLPTQRGIDVLALAYREPKNLRDKAFSAVAAICMCAPIRIHEVLQLKVECGCDDQRRNDDGKVVQAFGLRVTPGKGNAPQVKWVPDVMAGTGREAVSRLREISAQAREIATWYVTNPTAVYLPPDAEHLRKGAWLGSIDLRNLLGVVQPTEWAKKARLSVTKAPPSQSLRYSFMDFERAILAQLPKDFPLQNGHAGHPYSESLVLVRHGALRADTVGEGSRVMFEPVSIDTFGRWLSGTQTYKSVFARYGFVQDDGSPIEQTSHGFRHWLNDVAHRRGVSTMDIAHWSGRHPAQNKYYDHQTPAQFHAKLLDMAKNAGGIGPLFEAADGLPDTLLMSKNEFLAAQIGAAHQTDLGACIHDYSLLPCQKFGNCLDCEENVFVKADRKHLAKIEERYALTANQLEAARVVMDDGEFGADLWAQDHEASLRRLSLMLSVHNDPSIPDGTVVTLPADKGDTEISLALRERDAKTRLD